MCVYAWNILVEQDNTRPHVRGSKSWHAGKVINYELFFQCHLLLSLGLVPISRLITKAYSCKTYHAAQIVDLGVLQWQNPMPSGGLLLHRATSRAFGTQDGLRCQLSAAAGALRAAAMGHVKVVKSSPYFSRFQTKVRAAAARSAPL